LTRIKTTGEGAAELKKALLKREIIHNAKKQPAQLFRPPPTAFTPDPVRRRVAGMKQFLLLTLLLAFTASAFEFTGKVVGVADGDTITVLAEGNKQHKVRLQHIDCPETRQPFGSKAKQFLSQKVFSKSVTVKWDEMDRYKRILGNVYLGEEWVNLELVKVGLAWQAGWPRRLRFRLNAFHFSGGGACLPNMIQYRFRTVQQRGWHPNCGP
jgi:endonuclease YncB( thermonuclease family)